MPARITRPRLGLSPSCCLGPNGRPQGIILSGPYLSDPQLIAVGYALEQALNGCVEPDLDATIAQIDAVTGK